MQTESQLSPEIVAAAKKLVAKREANLEKTRENLTKYPHAKADTLKFDDAAGKFSVEIECTKCGESRRVYTSDLFQVKTCVACAGEAKKEKAGLKRELLKKAMEAIKNGEIS